MSATRILDRVSGPADVKLLAPAELAQLAHDLPDEFRTGLWSDQSGDVIVADACLRLRALGVDEDYHGLRQVYKSSQGA